ncbi:MAG TPA: hypothetical protein VN451_06970 [Chitinophagaceae bacterium]|nr:hypothetical protein [Chitinophagaceae bacterium]
MGYIKEPVGVDFFVDPKPLTAAERKRISEIIAYYKATGRKMPMKRTKAKASSTSRRNKRVLA